MEPINGSPTNIEKIIGLSIVFSKNNVSKFYDSKDDNSRAAEFNQGILLLERVINLIGEDPRVCAELAASLAMQARLAVKDKRFDDAEKLVRRAYKYNPVDEKKSACVVFYNMGMTLEEGSKNQQGPSGGGKIKKRAEGSRCFSRRQSGEGCSLFQQATFRRRVLAVLA